MGIFFPIPAWSVALLWKSQCLLHFHEVQCTDPKLLGFPALRNVLQRHTKTLPELVGRAHTFSKPSKKGFSTLRAKPGLRLLNHFLLIGQKLKYF